MEEGTRNTLEDTCACVLYCRIVALPCIPVLEDHHGGCSASAGRIPSAMTNPIMELVGRKETSAFHAESAYAHQH